MERQTNATRRPMMINQESDENNENKEKHESDENYENKGNHETDQNYKLRHPHRMYYLCT